MESGSRLLCAAGVGFDLGEEASNNGAAPYTPFRVCCQALAQFFHAAIVFAELSTSQPRYTVAIGK